MESGAHRTPPLESAGTRGIRASDAGGRLSDLRAFAAWKDARVSTTAQTTGTCDVATDLARTLRAAVRGEVETSTRVRAQYTTDASNYRVVPQVVVCPLDTDDLLAVAEVARSTGTPLTLRGGGTSVAGNAVGPGIVVDTSRHLTAIGEIDDQARTAVVQPGVIMSDLQAAAKPLGLRFGPDPAGGFHIPGIRLSVRGDAGGLDAETFARVAQEAKETCPVSKALRGVSISLEATAV